MVLLFPPTAPGLGYWWDLSMALGFGARGGVGSRRTLEALFDWTVATPAVQDSLSPSAVRAKRRYEQIPEADMLHGVARGGALVTPGAVASIDGRRRTASRWPPQVWCCGRR
jgi:hypothetical protein